MSAALQTVVEAGLAPELLAAPAAASAAPAAEFLYLDQAAVLAAGVLDMPLAMAAVGAALLEWRRGKVRQPHKLVLRAADDAACERDWRINGLCAALGTPPRCLGIKWVASFPHNRALGLPRASAVIILNRPDTGLPLCILDGTLISAMRTGAVTALGARALAPGRARRAAILGAGVQARTQALAVWTACAGLEQVAIVHRDRAAAERCAADCRRLWGIAAVAALNRPAALRAADVVVTITTAEEPLLFAGDVKPGGLSVQLAGHECDFGLIAECDKIVCDDWETIKHRGIMSPALMHAQGLLPDERIHASLGEVLSGERNGREGEERIHFAHMGLGLDDVALADAIYQRASAAGLGQRLHLWDQPLWA